MSDAGHVQIAAPPSAIMRLLEWAQKRTLPLVIAGGLITGLGGSLAAFTDVGRHLEPYALVFHGWLQRNVIRQQKADELCKNEGQQTRALAKLNNYEAQLKSSDLVDPTTRSVYRESVDRLKKKLARLEKRHKTLALDLGLDGDDDDDCD